MKPICIIPARSGSKGLPDKNMLFLDGKPLIYHTIDAAIESNLFAKEDIYVSTDSDFYSEICIKKGISVKKRSEELASDNSTTADMLLDFLKDFPEDQIFSLLQVTSPLRNGQHLKEAMKLFIDSDSTENVVSFSKADKHPSLLSTITDQGYAIDIAGVDKGYRRQDKKEFFYPNGAIFISSKSHYLKNQSFFTLKTKAYLMDHKYSYDIDYIEDFKAVLGQLYFDYSKREKNNQTEYTSFLKEKLQNINFHRAILGDSRTLNLKLPSFINLSYRNVSIKSISDNMSLIRDSGVDEVILVAGINDVSAEYPIETILENIKSVINFCIKEKIKITIANIPYSLFRAEIDNLKIERINSEILQFSKDFEILLVDLNSKFRSGRKLNFDFTYDGLHFNNKGIQLLQNEFDNVID